MDKKIGIGIIGCGVINDTYMTNLTQHYKNVELLACTDLIYEKAQKAAEKFGVPRVCKTNAELLAMDDIQIVLNLTNPAAHYEVDMEILNAGKHLYCEKPLALEVEDAQKVVDLAKEKGLMAVGAPDTFLGAAGQTCRELIDQGRIGKPIGFTANMTCCGHEIWHPNPEFLYEYGAGPMFDMGPYYMTMLSVLLGPIKSISAYAISGRPVRDIWGTPKQTEVPTHYTGIMEFQCGATGTVLVSCDTWHSGLPFIEIYGTEGTLIVPDPNYFTGTVKLFDGIKYKDIVINTEEAPVPINPRLFAMVTRSGECLSEEKLLFPSPENDMVNMRGLGVSDMAQSLIDGRKCRLDPQLSLHVVEALNAFEKSAETRSVYEMKTTFERTEPMGKDWELWEVR